MSKETAKKFDLSENNVNVASGPKVQNIFFNTIQPVSLDIIKPWSVTCPSTVESLQTLEFEVKNDINSKVSLYQGDITKINVDAIVNSVNKTLIRGGHVNGAIHEAALPGLIDECQKLNGCESGERKVTLDYKLPVKYVFYKLNDFYKSCLQKVLAYNVKSIAFCCGASVIAGFHPREAAQIALATDKLWLESNHSSIDRVVFCAFENADYQIYKDLMSSVYFPVSKYHFTNIYMKENSNTDCVVNVKSVGISNELGQSLPGLHSYPNFAQNRESESFCKKIQKN